MPRLPRLLDATFAAHPRHVGESYLAHAATALRFGGTMVAGGLACMIHGIVPALFTTTGSGTVRRLHARMQGRAHVAAEAESAARGCLSYEI
ncbi:MULTISPECIES: DUF6356 family protein [unclassified Sphingomonas]|jgi:Family of unknown function (DUF6356)|uniref:DUF6356 family protein n=1 Tax=unclassified Sphingomonas TaxID=196159 RepID=UPI000E10E499|nr:MULTISPECIES: DUF6356 family protein [unclassified Sphingomonas]AXJ95725.1 hypothetical protein DM480_09605 [Sphingomonas sp. FARSPH]